MPRSPAAFLCGFLILAALSLTTAADELQLKNGDFISGHIVSMDEETVHIRTSYGELSIDRSQIASGIFFADEPIPDGNLELELLFDDETGHPENPNVTIAEYGVLRSAGADGVADSAIRSTGKGTYIEITGLAELDSADKLTISFWINPKEAARLQYVLSKWDVSDEGEADGKFAVGIRDSALFIYLMDADGTYRLQSFEDVVPVGTWTHVAVVFESGLTTVYQNGAFSGTSKVDISVLRDSAAPIYVMTAKASTEDRWSRYNLNGALDNLRIYSRALEETEIADLAEEM